LNLANFDLPGNALKWGVDRSARAIIGTTPAGHDVNRVGVETSVYTLGSPRQIGFALRVSF
jgi:hypothetical protein